MKKQSAKRIASAAAAVLKDVSGKAQDDPAGSENEPTDEGAVAQVAGLDVFPAQMDGGEETVKGLNRDLDVTREQEIKANLFKGLFFFFSREVS